MAMINTYWREGDALMFRQAWTIKEGLMSNEGKVGNKGKARGHAARSCFWPDNPTPTELFRTYREDSVAAGYRVVPAEEHGWVVLQCWVHSPDLSHPDDERLFEEAEAALTDYLGWRGVGHVDGYDVGRPLAPSADPEARVMNIFCQVIDVAAGIKVVRAFAREFGISCRYLIGARKPGSEDYVLGWSASKRDREFFL